MKNFELTYRRYLSGERLIIRCDKILGRKMEEVPSTFQRKIDNIECDAIRRGCEFFGAWSVRIVITRVVRWSENFVTWKNRFEDIDRPILGLRKISFWIYLIVNGVETVYW